MWGLAVKGCPAALTQVCGTRFCNTCLPALSLWAGASLSHASSAIGWPRKPATACLCWLHTLPGAVGARKVRHEDSLLSDAGDGARRNEYAVPGF